jgi:hypothetical protein
MTHNIFNEELRGFWSQPLCERSTARDPSPTPHKPGGGAEHALAVPSPPESAKPTPQSLAPKFDQSYMVYRGRWIDREGSYLKQRYDKRRPRCSGTTVGHPPPTRNCVHPEESSYLQPIRPRPMHSDNPSWPPPTPILAARQGPAAMRRTPQSPHEVKIVTPWIWRYKISF